MNAILRLTSLGLAGAALVAAHGLAQQLATASSTSSPSAATSQSPAVPVAISVVRETSFPRYGWTPGCGWSEAPCVHAVAPPANPLVEIAICLDTSGSMDGLIGSAKQKLWAIVNEFVFAEPMPRLRVALYTYGNDGHSAENGWVNLECPLTEDLDLVSERLFAQTTNGGTELVGRVVNAAAGQLDWSPDPGALKLIVVAGNETADQDTVVSFRDACAGAIARDIMVDAIYCGAPGDGDAESWRQVARLADGQFMAIDQGLGTLAVATPFDAQLAQLSTELNGTYLAFGTNGAWYASNQAAQDDNAAQLNSEAAATRAFCKANALYNCASWDLVDALEAGSVVLADLPEEELPEALRALTPAEREQHVAQLRETRTRLQSEVNGVAQQREAYLQAETQRQLGAAAVSLDAALKASIRSRARSKGYRFQAPAASVEAPALEASEAPAPVQELQPLPAASAPASPQPAPAAQVGDC